MKRSFWALALALFAYGSIAQAGVITFEDATPESVYGEFVAQGYKGFNWTGGTNQYSWVLAQPFENIFTAHSGSNYVWSNGGSSLTMSGPVFNFDSLWIRSGQNAGTETAHGFLNGVEIYTREFNVGTDYAQVNLNFAGIDSITFDRTNFNLVIDDISVDTATSPAPEPASMSLLAAGALGMLGYRMRRQVNA